MKSKHTQTRKRGMVKRNGAKQNRSSTTTVTMTLNEAQTRATHGETRTDWDRIRRMTETEVEANALSDPDNPPWTTAMLAKAAWVNPEKQAISIRLDKDIVDFFQRQGRGYQSRINAALRVYMDAHRRKAS